MRGRLNRPPSTVVLIESAACAGDAASVHIPLVAMEVQIVAYQAGGDQIVARRVAYAPTRWVTGSPLANSSVNYRRNRSYAKCDRQCRQACHERGGG